MQDLSLVITAVSLLVTSLATLIVALRSSRQVDKVKEIVNGKATAQEVRIFNLEQALRDHGKEVPKRKLYKP
jgi:hypothetical protein